MKRPITINLDEAWEQVPIGAENAVWLDDLSRIWNVDRRGCRQILHDLNARDNGDSYIIVRSSSQGIFRTDDEKLIRRYKGECLSMGINTLSPLGKINRLLNEEGQITFEELLGITE